MLNFNILWIWEIAYLYHLSTFHSFQASSRDKGRFSWITSRVFSPLISQTNKYHYFKIIIISPICSIILRIFFFTHPVIRQSQKNNLEKNLFLPSRKKSCPSESRLNFVKKIFIFLRNFVLGIIIALWTIDQAHFGTTRCPNFSIACRPTIEASPLSIS